MGVFDYDAWVLRWMQSEVDSYRTGHTDCGPEESEERAQAIMRAIHKLGGPPPSMRRSALERVMEDEDDE